MSQALINTFEVKLATPECLPTSARFSALISLEENISEVLPYLNAALGGYDYYHQDKILLWADKGRLYAFRPYEIAIAPVNDLDEARELADRVVKKVNDVWQRRNEIEPNLKGRKTPPSALQIFKLLPGTNCKACGFTTCMAFAAAVRTDSTKSTLCPYLSEQEYETLLHQDDSR